MLFSHLYQRPFALPRPFIQIIYLSILCACSTMPLVSSAPIPLHYICIVVIAAVLLCSALRSMNASTKRSTPRYNLYSFSSSTSCSPIFVNMSSSQFDIFSLKRIYCLMATLRNFWRHRQQIAVSRFSHKDLNKRFPPLPSYTSHKPMRLPLRFRTLLHQLGYIQESVAQLFNCKPRMTSHLLYAA